MSEIFKLALSLSLSGSVLAVVAFGCCRLLGSRLSKRFQYYIWLVVVLRLLLPLSPESAIIPRLWEAAPPVQAVSDKPSSALIEQQAAPPSEMQAEIAEAESRPAETVQRPAESRPAPATPQTPQKVEPAVPMLETLLPYLWIVWLAVAAGLMVRKITLYQSFVKYLRAGRAVVDDIETLDRFSALSEQMGIRRVIDLYTNRLTASPLILGFRKVAVVLPEIPANGEEFRLICLHELTHYRRGDIWYKWLLQIVLCLHWFNPIVHLMVREVNRLCELSCDEAVLGALNAEEHRHYGDTLLQSLQTPGTYREGLAALTLNESARSLKERLDSIMKFTKPNRATALMAVVLAVLLFTGGYALGAYTVKPESVTPQANIVYDGLAERMITEFSQSVKYDKDKDLLNFTIPNQLPTGYMHNIIVAGRVKMGDGGMSIHLFEQESAKNSWEAGKTYSHQFDGDSLLDMTILYGIEAKESSETIAEAEIYIDENGEVTIQYLASFPQNGSNVYDPHNEPFGYDGSVSDGENTKTETDSLTPLKPEILPVLQALIAEYDNQIDNINFAAVPDYCALPEIESAADFSLTGTETGLSATIPVAGASEWQMEVLASNFDGVYRAEGASFSIIPDSFMGKAMARELAYTQVKTLINSGLSEDEILSMPIEEIQKLFAQFVSPDNNDDEDATPIPNADAPLGSAENPKVEDMTDPDVKGTTVINLNSNGQNSLTHSSSFEVGVNQVLRLEIESSISGTVDFYLFSPVPKDGVNQTRHYTFGGENDTKTFRLSEGRWAYNCTGFFDSGNISIKGVITNAPFGSAENPKTPVMTDTTAKGITSTVDAAALSVMQYSHSWDIVEYMLPYMTKSGIDDVVALNNRYEFTASKTASDFYNLKKPTQSETDSRAYTIMEMTGNWEYASPLFPYMSNSGIDEVVALYNQKTDKHVRASDYYNNIK